MQDHVILTALPTSYRRDAVGCISLMIVLFGKVRLQSMRSHRRNSISDLDTVSGTLAFGNPALGASRGYKESCCATAVLPRVLLY